jgi:hypothetical protein
VLEIPSHSSHPRHHHRRTPPPSSEDSGDAVASGPDLRFNQLLKFFGCWKATVTRGDLTAFASGQGTEGWTDKRYTICFERDMRGELEPTISQAEAGGKDMEDMGSDTELVGFDNKAVTLVNNYRFLDKSAQKEAPASWFGFRRTPEPVEVTQVTHVNCLRESMDLICTATATAECGDKSCYSFAWKARLIP